MGLLAYNICLNKTYLEAYTVKETEEEILIPEWISSHYGHPSYPKI